MEQELFRQIGRGNSRIVQKLCQENLQQTWFLAYHMTENTAIAGPMVVAAWQEALEELSAAKEAPKESMLCLLSIQLLRLWKANPTENPDFADLDPPQVASRYQVFTAQFSKIEAAKRPYYLLQVFGEASIPLLAKESGNSAQRIREWIQSASAQILQGAKKQSTLDSTELLRLSTDFRCSDRRGTKAVQVPAFVTATLEHTLSLKATLPTETSPRKESTSMNFNVSNRKKHAKIRKTILIIAVVCVVAAAGSFTAVKLASKNAVSAEITTTYDVEAITYGDVNSTISGSGTLTPVTNKTISCENPCTVKSVSVTVGDTVSEGDVLAVVTETITNTVVNEETREMEEETSTQETQLTAPCDGIVTDLPVAAEDSVEAGGEIAMVMGTDGFLLNLSVDELDIANVSIGQEVTVSVEAVSGEYTGEVTNVSYNGTTNGSNTYYQITAKIDYEEGIYSGMSASAEIVTESSGDGLLVPVSAVKTSGDDSYVTLAPDGAASGDSYEEDELDADSLTQVTVETGMSDGSYIMITSDELEEGDLIVVETVSTTATGSGSSDNGGNMPGGFGGGDMGNMDFGDFDPSNMPQGGGPGSNS